MEKGLLLSWLAFLPPGSEYSGDTQRYNSCCPIKGKTKAKTKTQHCENSGDKEKLAEVY